MRFSIFFIILYNTLFVYGKEDSLEIKMMSIKDLELEAKKALDGEDYVKALDFDKAGVEKANEEKKYRKEASFHQHIGLIHYEINDYEKCIEEYLLALELYEKEPKEKEIREIKRLIGDMYLRLDQCDLSFEYLRQSLGLATIGEGIKDQATSYLFQSIGIAHGRCGDIDSALIYFNKALEFAEEPVSAMLAGGLLNNIGAIYSMKDQNDLSLQYYTKSEELFRKENIQQGIAVSLSNRAYIHQKEKHFEKSIGLYKRALALFEETNSLMYLRDNYLNVSDLYEDHGYFREALEFKNKYLELNDSIASIELLSSISDLHVQFEIRKKDQEVVIAKQQEKIATQKNERTNLVLLFTVIGVVLLGAVVFLFVRNLRVSLHNSKLKQKILKQEKKDLKKDIEVKESEVQTLAMRMVERNKLLESLKQEIKDIDSKTDVDRSKLEAVERTISDRLYIEKDKQEFEYNLNIVHQQFLSKLSKKHPNLTKNDKRLCSLIMMDITTKEMSILLGISVDGVKKGRYRLRKKLELKDEFPIKEYLDVVNK